MYPHYVDVLSYKDRFHPILSIYGHMRLFCRPRRNAGLSCTAIGV